MAELPFQQIKATAFLFKAVHPVVVQLLNCFIIILLVQLSNYQLTLFFFLWMYNYSHLLRFRNILYKCPVHVCLATLKRRWKHPTLQPCSTVPRRGAECSNAACLRYKKDWGRRHYGAIPRWNYQRENTGKFAATCEGMAQRVKMVILGMRENITLPKQFFLLYNTFKVQLFHVHQNCQVEWDLIVIECYYYNQRVKREISVGKVVHHDLMWLNAI